MRSLAGFLACASSTAAMPGAARRSGKPRLVYQETDFNRAVLQRCPLLTQEYEVLPWFWNGHVETIFAALTRRSPRLAYERRLVPLEDGGCVALDFQPLDVQRGLPSNAPLVVILPGLTGGSQDSYVQHAVLAAREAGMRGVVFNPRGLADSPVLTPRLYSASYTGDLRRAVAHLQELLPDARRLYAVGFSLGANLMVNFLAEDGERTPFSAAVSLCNPFNLGVSDAAISRGFSRMYNRRLGANLAANFRPHRHLYEGEQGKGYDLEGAAKARTIREFDDALTIHTFGWPSTDAYYAGSSSDQRVGAVKVPLLAIQAEDDPLALPAAIPEHAMLQNPNCLLARTPAGGHLGWVRRRQLFGGPWTDACIRDFLTAAHELLPAPAHTRA